jgi:hypothetical protein
MVDPQHLRDFAWAITSVMEVVLVGYLLRRGLYRSHPAFVFYIVAALLQSLVIFLAYQRFDFRSVAAWWIGWSSQTLLTGARWLASLEIARRLLSNYSGIWALAKRVLLTVSVIVLIYSLFFTHGDWYFMVMSMERGLKLAVASFIVLVLLFARYYRVPVFSLERTLAIGFFLYSCFSVVNYSLFERWFEKYSNLWNFLDILFFLASVLTWIYAVRTFPVEKTASSPIFISPESHGKLSGQLNLRLRLLNDHLAHLLRSGDPRP